MPEVGVRQECAYKYLGTYVSASRCSAKLKRLEGSLLQPIVPNLLSYMYLYDVILPGFSPHFQGPRTCSTIYAPRDIRMQFDWTIRSSLPRGMLS